MTSSGKEYGGHSDPCGILAAMRTGQSRWDEGRSRWDEGRSRWDEGRSRWDEGRSRRDEGRSRRGGAAAPARYAASKVPLITAYFWIIKLLTTAMGEATSDYMVRTIN